MHIWRKAHAAAILHPQRGQGKTEKYRGESVTEATGKPGQTGEVKAMLKTCAKRMIQDEWACDLSTKPKLDILQLLKEKGSGSMFGHSQ